MRGETIARNYAEALLELARKGGDLAGWGDMIGDVADAMGRDESLRHFLESPRIAAEQKNEILARAFQDRMPRVLVRREMPGSGVEACERGAPSLRV